MQQRGSPGMTMANEKTPRVFNRKISVSPSSPDDNHHHHQGITALSDAGAAPVTVSHQHDYHDKRLFFVGGNDGNVRDEDYYEGDQIAAGATAVASADFAAPVPLPIGSGNKLPFADEKKDNDDNDVTKAGGGNNSQRRDHSRRPFTSSPLHFSSPPKGGLLRSATASAFTKIKAAASAAASRRRDPPAVVISDPESPPSSPDDPAYASTTRPPLPPPLQTATTTPNATPGYSAPSFSPSPPPPSPAQAKAAYEVVAKLQLEAAMRKNSRQGQRKSSHNMRSASPMARMRDNTITTQAAQEDFNQDQNTAASSGLLINDQPNNVRFKFADKPKPKSDKDIKREKSMKWKKKMMMKEAQQRKRQERKKLDEGQNNFMSSNPLAAITGGALIACVLDEVEQTNFIKTFTQCGGDLADGDDSVYAYSEAESASSRSYSGSDDDRSNSPRRGRSRQRRPSHRKPSVDSSNASSTVDPSTVGSATEGGTEASETDSRRLKTVLSDNVDSLPTNAGAYAGTLSNSSDVSSPGAASSTKPAYVSPTRDSSSTLPTYSSTHTSNKSFAKAFIAKMEHHGARILWHKETSVMNPTTVTMELKKGHRCPDGTHCGPLLVWSEIEDENGDHGGTKKHYSPTYGVSLFDIGSLERADPLQLENFPFAIPGRTICLNVKTAGGSDRLIFEATSEDDASRMVRGMKLVVARLARNLVMGNLEVSCELLDLVDGDGRFGIGSPNRSRRSAMEFDWSRAMDDVAEQLIETTLAPHQI